MGPAIAVRRDYSSRELRRLATRVKDAAQARRLLAIAAVLHGGSGEEADEIGGMDRQTLRDWVIRFNEEGPDSLVNKSSPGAPGKLTEEHKAVLVRLVEEGPIPAVDGGVRWRGGDLIMRLYEEFGISVSDDTVYRALKDLGFSHVSARPKAYKQNADAMEAFKKTFPPAWRKSGRSLRPAHRKRCGARTRCGLARRTSSPIVGPGRVHGPAPFTINAPSPPICSVPYVPNAGPAAPSCCPPATARPCRCILTTSQPRSLTARMRAFSSIKPAGMAPRLSRSRAISRSCCCRHALPNSTARKMFGSSCARIGCQTGSSNPSTISSTTAATPGTRSSISPGRSCPSRAAIGRAWVIQCEDWYKAGKPRSAGTRRCRGRRDRRRARRNR